MPVGQPIPTDADMGYSAARSYQPPPDFWQAHGAEFVTVLFAIAALALWAWALWRRLRADSGGAP